MSRTHKDARKRGHQPRHISVRGVRRHQIDVPKLSRALIELALLEAAAEKAAQHDGDAGDRPTKRSPGDLGHD